MGKGVPAVMQLSVYVVPSSPPLGIGFFQGCLHAYRPAQSAKSEHHRQSASMGWTHCCCAHTLT